MRGADAPPRSFEAPTSTTTRGPSESSCRNVPQRCASGKPVTGRPPSASVQADLAGQAQARQARRNCNQKRKLEGRIGRRRASNDAARRCGGVPVARSVGASRSSSEPPGQTAGQRVETGSGSPDFPGPQARLASASANRQECRGRREGHAAARRGGIQRTHTQEGGQGVAYNAVLMLARSVAIPVNPAAAHTVATPELLKWVSRDAPGARAMCRRSGKEAFVYR